MTRVKKGDREGRKLIRGQWVYREPSEWLVVNVPAVVSRELFDKVQERLREHDASMFRFRRKPAVSHGSR
jgi:hypothetical protein